MGKRSTVYTVILGDLVQSSRLKGRPALARRIEHTLSELSGEFASDIYAPLSLTTGIDEFSGVLFSPTNSFKICALLNEEIYPRRFRFSIAEGSLDVALESLDAAKMDGPAFHIAARAMRRLKTTGNGFVFELAEPLTEFGPLISQLASLYVIIAGDRTPHQNEITRRYRHLPNQVRLAAELGITQQAVSDALRSAYWSQLSQTESLISSLLDRRSSTD